MARHKDTNWNLPEGQLQTWEQVSVAVLMDIRDELKHLNGLLNCPNFLAIPGLLKEIKAKLPSKRQRKPKHDGKA